MLSRKSIAFLLAVVVALLPFTIQASYSPPTLVFVIAGQSNASGRGVLSALPPGFPTNGSRITNFTNAWTFIPAAEPLDLTVRDPITGQWDQLDGISRDQTTGVGFGLAFADRVAASLPNRIVLVQCSKGGSPSTSWLPDPLLRRDRLFGSCLWRTLFVLAQTRGVLAGLLWYQGEANADDLSLAASYLANTQSIFDSFRNLTGYPDLPVFLVQLHPQIGSSSAVHWNSVRTDQASMARTCSQHVVPALGTLQDTVHLSTLAQLDLGSRMGDDYLQYLRDCL